MIFFYLNIKFIYINEKTNRLKINKITNKCCEMFLYNIASEI